MQKFSAVLVVMLLVTGAVLPAAASTGGTHVIKTGGWTAERSTRPCTDPSDPHQGIPQISPLSGSSGDAYALRLFETSEYPIWNGLMESFGIGLGHENPSLESVYVSEARLCAAVVATSMGRGPSCADGFALRDGTGSATVDRDTTATVSDVTSIGDVAPALYGWRIPLSGDYVDSDGVTGTVQGVLNLRPRFTPLQECGGSTFKSLGTYELTLNFMPSA